MRPSPTYLVERQPILDLFHAVRTGSRPLPGAFSVVPTVVIPTLVDVVLAQSPRKAMAAIHPFLAHAVVIVVVDSVVPRWDSMVDVVVLGFFAAARLGCTPPAAVLVSAWRIPCPGASREVRSRVAGKGNESRKQGRSNGDIRLALRFQGEGGSRKSIEYRKCMEVWVRGVCSSG